MSALVVPALLGAVVSRNPRKRVLFLALAVIGLVEQDQEEQEHAARRQRRRLWWNAALNKRAPVLSKSIRAIRVRRFFGAASNYGRQLAIQNPLSPAMFYSFFRFSREDIPRLVRALRLPGEFYCPLTRIRCGGEEALLILLKRMSYANRWVDCEFIFGRVESWLERVFYMILEHLYEFAYHICFTMDVPRLQRMMAPVFAAAIHAKGAPLENCIGFIDGTFRHFCRPAKDGYNGIAQRMQYSGHKKEHGNNHQGIETPDGLIVEMHGPFEGRTNDKRMVADSQILNRLAQFFPGYCLYGDKGYDHGNPALQTPYKGRKRIGPVGG